LESELRRNPDPDLREDRAIALIRLGRVEEGRMSLEELLRDHPARPRTLHNLAVLNLRQGRLDQARENLTELNRLDPQFAHGVTAGLLVLAEFRRLQSLRPDWSQRNLLTPELTRLWEERSAHPTGRVDRREGRRLVEGLQPSFQAVVEMLRRFPEFGDGWVALGLMHELQGDFLLAVRAYRLALQRGTGLRSALERHIVALTPAAENQNPARTMARQALLSLLIFGTAGFVVWLWRTTRAIKADLREARLDSAGKPPQGPYGPLGKKPLD
jgi:tetratricopeptide (TPR) repeat protein